MMSRAVSENAANQTLAAWRCALSKNLQLMRSLVMMSVFAMSLILMQQERNAETPIISQSAIRVFRIRANALILYEGRSGDLL